MKEIMKNSLNLKKLFFTAYASWSSMFTDQYCAKLRQRCTQFKQFGFQLFIFQLEKTILLMLFGGISCSPISKEASSQYHGSLQSSINLQDDYIKCSLCRKLKRRWRKFRYTILLSILPFLLQHWRLQKTYSGSTQILSKYSFVLGAVIYCECYLKFAGLKYYDVNILHVSADITFLSLKMFSKRVHV